MNPRPDFFTKWNRHWSCDVMDGMFLGLQVNERMDFRDAPGFMHFRTAHHVEGLAHVNGAALHILAVNWDKPGTDQFRRFIADAKSKFREITFWSIMTDDMMPILAHYGFVPCVGADRNLKGERVTTEGMRWRKNEPVPHETLA